MRISEIINHTNRPITIKGNNEYSSNVDLSEINITYHDGEPPLSNEEFHALAEQVQRQNIVLAVEEALNAHLSATARQKKYDNQYSIATYTGSANATWKAEADAFVAWRDNVWTYAIAQLELFQNNEREVVSEQDFINELPAMVWPE